MGTIWLHGTPCWWVTKLQVPVTSQASLSPSFRKHTHGHSRLWNFHSFYLHHFFKKQFHINTDSDYSRPGTVLVPSSSVSEKVGLKLNIQKTKIMASGPITSWQIDGETVETVRDFILGAPKSLQMVTVAMKLKDACSVEEKLWPT